MKKEFNSGFKSGLGFITAIVIVIGVILGVYAFVEPTNGPSNNYVFDWSSPFASKVNDTNVKVTAVQTTTTGLSANNGMYDNRIPSGSFPTNYSEICFKGGATQYDTDLAGTSTTGGNCDPGDVGFIMEQNKRTTNYWEQAKGICLQLGMRLPEPFEYKYACVGTFGLNGMGTGWEWVSNFALPMYDSNSGVGAAVMGGSGCGYAGWGWVGRADGGQSSGAFRCAK